MGISNNSFNYVDLHGALFWNEEGMKITKEQLFDFNKTKYNGWGCGYGCYKNKKKYDRKNKQWKKELFD